MRRFDGILNGTSGSVTSVLARGGLWLASQPYGAVVRFRNWMYDRGWWSAGRASLPVISVGNLTAGGTGKSPACVYLARWFRSHGVRVAILSRGYGALADGVNDEAKEMESMLPDVPQLQSPDRLAMARLAHEELDMQLLLLDDAFQHRKIKRDLDIVLIDATEPFGYGHLLPRGLLREPIGSIRRADIVLATRADQVDAQRLADIRTLIQRYNPRAAWIEAEHAGIEWVNSDGETCGLASFQNTPALAISGIGNPKGFETSLQRVGVEWLEHRIFADHHPYSQEDLRNLEVWIESAPLRPEVIVCTGKDLAKLATKRIGGVELWALRIQMKIVQGEEILEDRLTGLLARVLDPSE